MDLQTISESHFLSGFGPECECRLVFLWGGVAQVHQGPFVVLGKVSDFRIYFE
jgi:hypothetical protein